MVSSPLCHIGGLFRKFLNATELHSFQQMLGGDDEPRRPPRRYKRPRPKSKNRERGETGEEGGGDSIAIFRNNDNHRVQSVPSMYAFVAIKVGSPVYPTTYTQ